MSKLIIKNNKLLVSPSGRAYTTDCPGCCNEEDVVFIQANECCDNDPVIYISSAVLDQLNCSSDLNGNTVVKFGADCYRINPFVSYSRTDAENLGLFLVENIAGLTCAIAPPGEPSCSAPICRVCPQNCCYTFIVPGDCQRIVDNNNHSLNLCCNWGSNYTLTVNWTKTYNRMSKVACSGFGENNCAWYPENETTWTETGTSTKVSRICDASGRRSISDICSFSRNKNGLQKDWYDRGIGGTCDGFNYNETPISESQNTASCSLAGTGITLFPAALLDPDTNEKLPCSHHFVRNYNNSDGTRNVYTQTLVASIYNCFSGTYSLTINNKLYSGPAADGCQNTLIFDETQTISWNWNVNVTGRVFCEGNSTCNQYYGINNLAGRENKENSTVNEIGALDLL